MLEAVAHLPAGHLILLCLACYILVKLVKVLLDPLRRVPGPFVARFTRLWYLYTIWKGKFERVNTDLHKKYGPIVRIAPNEFSIDDVEAAKIIYGHGTAFTKASWYLAWMPLDPRLASLFADINPKHHGVQRRKFASAYSMSSLVGYETLVNECTSLFAARLCEIATDCKTVNLGHWFQCYAFDVIGSITFQERFGFLDKGVDEAGVFEAIDTRTSYSTFVGLYPFLHRIIFPFLPKSGGHGYVGRFTREQISKREQAVLNEKLIQNGEKEPTDLAWKFLKACGKDGASITRTDIFTMCQSNIGAGSDTTALTLSAALYYLLKHPTTYRRLQREIDEAASLSSISDPITFKEAQNLPYLQAVIREALRLHSATGLPLARIVPPTGAVIANHDFPGGATVGINSWVAHRNRSVYGEDAEIWRPERWLEINASGRGAEIERYFFAFGMGSRTCVGKNISLLEMSKLIPQILRKFNFELDPELVQHDWMSVSRWFVKPDNFFGKVTMRREL